MSNRYEILISARDAEALSLMLGDWPRRHRLEEEAAEALADRLVGARVVAPDQLPDGVVTMDSTVTYIELPDNRRSTVRIVYPAQADAGAGRVSVLSPIGRALLGRPVRSVTDIVLHVPRGERRRDRGARSVGALRNRVSDSCSARWKDRPRWCRLGGITKADRKRAAERDPAKAHVVRAFLASS